MSVLTTLRHVTLLVAVGLAATAGYEYRDVRDSSWSEEHVVALVQDLIIAVVKGDSAGHWI
jgi:hypothetical protein